MRNINLIVVHCSASDRIDQMTIEAITDLHTSPGSKKIQWGEYPTHGRDWAYIGYHYVIELDGSVKVGRPIELPGAHVKGHNANSIGICLAGNRYFSKEQKASLKELVNKLREDYDLETDQVVGHYELDPNKTCPNLNMGIFRSMLL